MKYWAILAAKLAVAAAVLYAVWLAMCEFYPVPPFYGTSRSELFLHDLPWTTLVFFYNLLVQGTLFGIILDQRYRCRTCGRRLRMPVHKGSHAKVLFAPPRTDYICTYGHGTLKVPEIQFTGREKPDWKQHDDIWKELFSTPRSERNPDA